MLTQIRATKIRATSVMVYSWVSLFGRFAAFKAASCTDCAKR